MQMLKRFGPTVVLILAIAISYGQKVSPNQASKVAKQFCKNVKDMSGLRPITRAIVPLKQGSDTVAYVVPLYPRGFVIISADQRLNPIVGFSNQGYWDTSDSATAVLQEIIAKAQKCRLNAAKTASASHRYIYIIKRNKALWANFLSKNLNLKDISQYGPWLTSAWGGVNCYDEHGNIIYVGNYYTPNHYSPGCVATAMSQLMYYYKWPLHGTGSHTDYDNQGSSQGTYYAYFYGTYYDWDNMLDKYYYVPSTDRQRRACGLLQYHAAISVDADFEYQGTTASTSDVPAALSNFWRYTGHYETRSWSAFWSRMQDNIQKGHPVLIVLNSSSSSMEHTVVADGYRNINDVSEYFHLNMGWWGACNGWYKIKSDFDACGYDYVEAGVFDIMPEPEIRPENIERTCDKNQIILRWSIPKNAKISAYRLEKSYDRSTWTLVSDTFTRPEALITLSGEPGDITYFRLKAAYNNTWYYGSYSNTAAIAVTDDLTFLDFDGNDSFYILDNADNDLDINDQWTIETWLYVDDYQPQDWSVIADRRGVFSLYLIDDPEADFAIRFARRNSNGDIITSLRSDTSDLKMFKNRWYHVAVTYDGSVARLFINGQLASEKKSVLFQLPASDVALNIGARYWGSYERYIKGKIDEFRISDTCRYNANFEPDRFARFEPDQHTVLLLHLDEGAGLDLFDAAKNFKYIRLRQSPNAPNWDYSPYIGNRWLGQVSDKWNNPLNWAQGVPSGTDRAYISANAKRFPLIDSIISCKHLRLEPDAKLFIAPNATLTVNGQLCNQGQITLKANHKGTGHFLFYGFSPKAQGDFNTQLFFAKQTYKYFGIPIGSLSSRTFTGPSQNFNPELYFYDETAADSMPWKTAYITNFIDAPMAATIGYAFKASQDTIYNIQGELNQQDFVLNLTCSGKDLEIFGWNLLSNPYAGILDWEELDKQNVANAIYTVDSGKIKVYLPAYGQMGAVQINGADGFIREFQGFWVKALDQGQIAMSYEQVKPQAGSRNWQTSNILRLKAKSNSWEDQTLIRFAPEQSDDFDPYADALKAVPTLEKIPQFFTINPNVNLGFAINTVDTTSGVKAFRLGLKNISPGSTITLSITENSLEQGRRIILVDKKLNLPVFLDEQNYSFVADTSDDTTRFLLYITDVNGNVDFAKTDIRIYTQNRNIYLIFPLDYFRNSRIELYDLTGRLLTIKQPTSNFTTLGPIEQAGAYVVKVFTKNSQITRKIIIN